MPTFHATASAHPNIAFIKYWGNRHERLRLPSNSSISMTMGGLITRTSVSFDPELDGDVLSIDGTSFADDRLQRVSRHLDLIRELSGIDEFARVVSENNFPVSAGLASSASAFAALTVAACAAAHYPATPRELSRLARRGSGSACRSIFGGFVEWLAGDNDEASYAQPLAEQGHWRLVDWVAIVEPGPKAVSSTIGHALAVTSPLQAGRVQSAPIRLRACRQAIESRDFEKLAATVELDCHAMHAVMMTSDPPLMYWSPASVAIMKAIVDWRSQGINVCYTLDAGPNVHCLCLEEDAAKVEKALQSLGVVSQLLRAEPGGPATLVDV